MNYHIYYRDTCIESFSHATTDAAAKKYADSRYTHYTKLEDDNHKFVAAKQLSDADQDILAAAWEAKTEGSNK